MLAHFPSFEKSVMQYSQYCRGPAAKAGRARHKISRPERFRTLKSENLPERQVRELRAFPEGNLTGAAALALSELVRQRRPRRRKDKSMRAPRHQTSRQVKITCTPANLFAVFYDPHTEK